MQQLIKAPSSHRERLFTTYLLILFGNLVRFYYLISRFHFTHFNFSFFFTFVYFFDVSITFRVEETLCSAYLSKKMYQMWNLLQKIVFEVICIGKPSKTCEKPVQTKVFSGLRSIGMYLAQLFRALGK